MTDSTTILLDFDCGDGRILDWTTLPYRKPILNERSCEFWMVVPDQVDENPLKIASDFFYKNLTTINEREIHVDPRPFAPKRILYSISTALINSLSSREFLFTSVADRFRIPVRDLRTTIERLISIVEDSVGERLGMFIPVLSEWLIYNDLSLQESSDDIIEFSINDNLLVDASLIRECRFPLKVGASYFPFNNPFDCPDVWDAIINRERLLAISIPGNLLGSPYGRPTVYPDIQDIIRFMNRVSLKSESLKNREDSIINDPLVRNLIMNNTRELRGDPVGDIVFGELGGTIGVVDDAEDMYRLVLNRINVQNLIRTGIACLSAATLSAERCRAIVRSLPAPLVYELFAFFRGSLAQAVKAQIARSAATKAEELGVPESAVIHEVVISATPEDMLCAAIVAAPFMIYYLITELDWSKVVSPITINFPDDLSTFDILSIISDLLQDILRAVIASAIIGVVKETIRVALESCSEQTGGISYGSGRINPLDNDDDNTEEIIKLFDDLSIMLTPQEICSLFLGDLSTELEKIISEFLRLRYPDIWAEIGCQSSVGEYFKSFADRYDLTYCSEIVDILPLESCDFGEGQLDLRAALLRNKGLTAQEIEKQLEQYQARQTSKLAQFFEFVGRDGFVLQSFLPSLVPGDGTIPNNIPSQQYAITRSIESLEESFIIQLLNDLRKFQQEVVAQLRNDGGIISAITNTENVISSEENDYVWVMGNTVYKLFPTTGTRQTYKINNKKFFDIPSDSVQRFLDTLPFNAISAPTPYYYSHFVKNLWLRDVGDDNNQGLIKTELREYIESTGFGLLTTDIIKYFVSFLQNSELFDPEIYNALSIDELSIFNIDEVVSSIRNRYDSQVVDTIVMGELNTLERSAIEENIDLITRIDVYTFFLKNLFLLSELRVNANQNFVRWFNRNVEQFNDSCYNVGNWLLAHAEQIVPEGSLEDYLKITRDSYIRSLDVVKDYLGSLSFRAFSPKVALLESLPLVDVLPNYDNHSDGRYQDYNVDSDKGKLILEKYILSATSEGEQVWNIDEFKNHVASTFTSERVYDVYTDLRWGLRVVYVPPEQANIFKHIAESSTTRYEQYALSYKTYKVAEKRVVPSDEENRLPRVLEHIFYNTPLVVAEQKIVDTTLVDFDRMFPLTPLRSLILQSAEAEFLFEYIFSVERILLFLMVYIDNFMDNELGDIFATSFSKLKTNFEVLLSGGDYRYEDRAAPRALDVLQNVTGQCFDDVYFKPDLTTTVLDVGCLLPELNFNLNLSNVDISSIGTATLLLEDD